MGLKELFKRIVNISGKSPQPEFYEDWFKLMSIYDYQVVESAWSQIKVSNEPWQFYSLKTWVSKTDYIHAQLKLTKESQNPVKQTRVEQDDEMRSWRDNYHALIERRITRGEYLKIAVEIGQMTYFEAEREKKTYLNRGDSLEEKAAIINTYEAMQEL